MKSSEYNKPSCCIIILQRRVSNPEEEYLEPRLAMGWIIHEDKHDHFAETRLLDALEKLGFTDSLCQRI